MKTIFPDYYPQFRCIAGDCKHSCCIGWEIDIDPVSMTRFDSVEGPLGDRLHRCIDRSGQVPHFILGGGDRCPFLNEQNLCNLILELGEDSLCQICADHPRFRNGFSDRTELGLGLCCEAAAALILGQSAPVTWLTADEGEAHAPDEWERAFFAFRDNTIAIAQDREYPISQRLEHLSVFAGTPLPGADRRFWQQTYLELERLDEGWTEVLHSLTDKWDAQWTSPTGVVSDDLPSRRGGNLPPDTEMAFEQLLVYFLYRHLPTAFDWGDPTAGAWFAIVSTQLLLWLTEANPELPLTELVRMYSGEIEYSDENMEILMNLMYEDDFLPYTRGGYQPPGSATS